MQRLRSPRECGVPRSSPFLNWQLLAEFLRSHVRTLSGLTLLLALAATIMLGMRWLSDPYRFPLSVVKVSACQA